LNERRKRRKNWKKRHRERLKGRGKKQEKEAAAREKAENTKKLAGKELKRKLIRLLNVLLAMQSLKELGELEDSVMKKMSNSQLSENSEAIIETVEAPTRAVS